MTSRSYLLASSLLLLACDGGAAKPTAVDQSGVESEQITSGAIPGPSDDCPEGFMEVEERCIPEKEAMALLGQKSAEAVQKMTGAAGDPEAQAQAQQEVVEIQEKKVDKITDEHDKIKKMIKEKKKAGKIKPVDNPFFFDKEDDMPDKKQEVEQPPPIEQRPPEAPPKLDQ